MTCWSCSFQSLALSCFDALSNQSVQVEWSGWTTLNSDGLCSTVTSPLEGASSAASPSPSLTDSDSAALTAFSEADLAAGGRPPSGMSCSSDAIARREAAPQICDCDGRARAKSQHSPGVNRRFRRTQRTPLDENPSSAT